jgi:hypothetical protein
MRSMDHRIFRTFEEFEREELRRTASVGPAADDDLATLLGGGEPGERRRRPSWDEDE